jgi:predicted metal-dependent hydrolase
MSRHHRSQLVVIAERQICLGGRVVPYVVKRSSVARQVRFEIKSGIGLAVILPRRCNLDAVDEMLESKSRWILGKIDRFGGPPCSAGNGRLRFGDAIPYLGQEVRIVSCQEIASVESVELQGQILTVYWGQECLDLKSLLECWYRAQAATILEQKAQEFAAAFGVRYSRFSIRAQRTRWASCSHRGTLSFNWRLIMAPEAVVDYVVIHEVAHLKEMNHTKRFWQLVAERCPSWREHKKWLDDHGTDLAAVLSLPE